MKKIFQWLNDLVSIFYPRGCIGCGIPLQRSENFLCLNCLLHLPETNYHLSEDNPLEKIFWGRVPVEHVYSFLFFRKGNTVQSMLHQLKYKGNKKAGTLTVMNKSEYYRITDEDRNYIDLDPEGIAISDKMAEVLGLEVGDKVRWHIAGDPKWIDSEITETYTVPYGQGMIMTPKTFDKEGGDDYNYSTNVILTKKNVNKNYTGVSSITTREDIQNGWNTMTEAMDMMITVLTTFAILLAVVVLYNLGLLSFTEIQRELATLKVLGFNSKSLRRLLLTQNLWFSTIGFILAIPGAYLLLGFMMGSVGDSYSFPINIY